MQNKRRTVITVDGLAGSGKTTLSRLLARETGFTHFYTGLLYRGVALLAIRSKVSLTDESAILTQLKTHKLCVSVNSKGEPFLTIDGENVSEKLHRPEVSEAASLVASLSEVRAYLVPLQRQAFPGQHIVAEGRDMGSVIFPDAELKFYVQVRQDVRVRRRLEQLYGKSYEELLAAKGPSAEELQRKIEMEIIERDKRDEERAASPARPADDAIIVDNSDSTLAQVLAAMITEVRKRGLLIDR